VVWSFLLHERILKYIKDVFMDRK